LTEKERRDLSLSGEIKNNDMAADCYIVILKCMYENYSSTIASLGHVDWHEPQSKQASGLIS